MGSWAVDQLMDAEPNKNIRRGNLPPVEKPRPTLSFDDEDLNNEQFIMLGPVRQLPILLCQTMRK
jgi:hypothetical protein